MITNTVSAIPLVGSRIVFWLWGGTFVGNATLSRFSTLHYVLPFVLLAVVMVHILLLHSVGSSGYLGMGNVCVDDKPFYPYYVVRDGLGLSVFMMVYMCLVCFYPNVLGSPDNYEVANVLVTPKHIVPEWYLMPYFSVLRGIPDKLAGVIGLAGVYGALAGVALIPSTSISKGKFWIFTCICLTLGYLGSCSMSVPYSGLMTYFTIGYFTWFFLISIFDRTKPKIIPTGRPTGRPRTP